MILSRMFGNNQVGVHSNIVVSDITFSHYPAGTQKSFVDGLWLKAYSGASNGQWLTWENSQTHPYWQHNPTNILGHNYVQAVCSQRP